MKNFPTLCIDNFLENPDAVRDFALSLDYTASENGSYAGVRSTAVHHLNLAMLTTVSKRLLSCFYDLRATPVTWEITSYFYKIYPTDDTTRVANPSGNIVDCVLFLNTNPTKPSGVSTVEPSASGFVETASFTNRYNRLVAYDGEVFTKDNGADCGEEFKLVQVFHIKQLVSQYLPLPRMREQLMGVLV